MMAAASDESTVFIGADEPERCVPDEEEIRSDMARFGPVYGEDTDIIIQKAKESAWLHILGTNGGDERSYFLSIAHIRVEAMSHYDSSIVESLKRQPDKFLRMMVRDGCLFLQLALLILGAGHELLGYPPQNPYFGKSINSRRRIPDMLVRGNQIPYVVLRALMEQAFFKRVINKGQWSRRPSQGKLVEVALYEMVVEPYLGNGKNVDYDYRLQPTILDALRNMLLGSHYTSPIERTKFQVLEHGNTTGNPVHFPRASELNRAGVKLIKKSGIGISKIRFKNHSYSASLYLPVLCIDTYTIDLLTSLVSYEQSLNPHEREVTAYISFIRDLATTYMDFKILESKGIIMAEDETIKSSFIWKLDKLVSRHPSNLTTNFNEIMRGIKEYETVPWQRLSITYSVICGIITFFLAVFTIVQTVFTVLSYYDKPT